MRRLNQHRVPNPADRLGTELRQRRAEIEAAAAALEQLIGRGGSVLERRAAHRRLRLAHLAADQLLRTATRAAREASYREWSRLRRELSALDTARHLHLMQESDDIGVLGIGSVRALDTGMSGPSIGERQHGAGVEADAPAGYGLDLDAVLEASPRDRASLFRSPGITARVSGRPHAVHVVAPAPTADPPAPVEAPLTAARSPVADSRPSLPATEPPVHAATPTHSGQGSLVPAW